MDPSRIFGITVAVSCVPFVLLFLIPPVLVAITLLPILLLLYGMESVVDRERDELARLPGRLPGAAILPRRRG